MPAATRVMLRAETGPGRAWLLLGALLAAACGGEQQKVAEPVPVATPEDQILRVATMWEARGRGKGLRSPPSEISVFEIETTSFVTFERGKQTAREELTVAERFEMRDGQRFRCEATGKLTLRVNWGERSGEPAVQLTRPPTTLRRRCRPGGYPEPEVDVPHGASRFVLRGDQLVAFAPPLEKRVFWPVQ